MPSYAAVDLRTSALAERGATDVCPSLSREEGGGTGATKAPKSIHSVV